MFPVPHQVHSRSPWDRTACRSTREEFVSAKNFLELSFHSDWQFAGNKGFNGTFTFINEGEAKFVKFYK